MKKLTLITFIALIANFGAATSLIRTFEVRGDAKVDIQFKTGYTCMAIGCPPAPTYYELVLEMLEGEYKGRKIMTGVQHYIVHKKAMGIRPTYLTLDGLRLKAGDRVYLEATVSLFNQMEDLHKIKIVQEPTEQDLVKLSCSNNFHPADGNFETLQVVQNDHGSFDITYTSIPARRPTHVINEVLADNVNCTFDANDSRVFYCTDMKHFRQPISAAGSLVNKKSINFLGQRAETSNKVVIDVRNYNLKQVNRTISFDLNNCK